MNFDYNYKASEKELINYILGYLVLISTQYIALKLLIVNLAFSLIMFLVLGFIAILYLLNIKKYNIFKNDYIIFLSIFYFFSLYFVAKLMPKIFKGQVINLILLIVIVAIWSIIYILSIYNTRYTKSLRLYKYLVNITIFLCNFLLFILLFSAIYMNFSNSYINEIIRDNFQKENEIYILQSDELKIDNQNYLHYDKNPILIINSSSKYYNEKQLNSFIKSKLNPISKIEDYIMFSIQNTLNGDCQNILYEGIGIKYTIVLQKVLFLILIWAGLIRRA